MLPIPTVFVLGAGAGVDIDMPVGSTLSDKISDKLSIRFDEFGSKQTHGDRAIADALRKHARELQLPSWNDWRVAGCGVASGINYTRSIDAYINMHKDNEKIKLCAKLAIVRSILEYERNSAVFIKDDGAEKWQNPTKVRSSWMSDLVYVLQDGIIAGETFEKLFDNCCFINFNYDRCLEQFMLKAVKDLTQRSDGDVEALLRKVTILRPYGSVGSLFRTPGTRHVKFGNSDYQDLMGLSNEIRTFNEQLDDTEELQALGQEISKADRIIFLGFHFHGQNMRLLRALPPSRNGAVNIFATAHQRSHPDIDLIYRQISEMMEPRGASVSAKVMINLDCKGMFRDYAGTFLSPHQD